MVSIMDVLSDGLSSVYTFFDPDMKGSLGTWNILWQLEQCRLLELPHLYLGYWIEQSPKMAYKVNFRPLEMLVNGEWREYAGAPDAQPAAPAVIDTSRLHASTRHGHPDDAPSSTS